MQHLPPLKRLLPEHPSRIYAAVGRCIYCGAVDGLGKEHIIPLGLGGRHVLPRASCKACSAKTSAFERTCQRTMYGPLRLLYGLPTRRERARPDTLPLKVKRSAHSDWEYVQVPQNRFPFLITFPHFPMPGVLSGEDLRDSRAAAKRLWIRGASPSHDFHALCDQLVSELGVHAIMPESTAEVEAMCRLLAKVAYSFAVARLGGKVIDSPLRSYATGGDLTGCLHYIGSRETDEAPAPSLHDLNMVYDPEGKLTAVRIRLLARLGTPTYFVVVADADDGARTELQTGS